MNVLEGTKKVKGNKYYLSCVLCDKNLLTFMQFFNVFNLLFKLSKFGSSLLFKRKDKNENRSRSIG